MSRSGASYSKPAEPEALRVSASAPNLSEAVEHPGAPEGGYGVDSRFAWLMAVTAFFICFIVYGVQYSFGAFFKSIAVDLGAGRADTAGIFSVNMFVANLFGVAAGYLGDRFGPRPLLIGGAVSVGFGLVMTSRIDHLWMGT